MQSAAARLPQSQVSEHPQLQFLDEEHVAPPGPSWHSSSAAIHVFPHGFPIQHTGCPLFGIFFISVGCDFLSERVCSILLNLMFHGSSGLTRINRKCELDAPKKYVCQSTHAK